MSAPKMPMPSMPMPHHNMMGAFTHGASGGNAGQAQLAMPADSGFVFVSLPGFADSSFEPVIQPPTNPYFNPDDAPPPYERSIPTSAAVTEEEIKAALKEFVHRNCCFGPPEKIQIRDIEMKSAFKYQLVSSTEQRQTVWITEPYSGQPLEGPSHERMMGPWEFRMHPDKSFQPEVKKLRIKNTSSIKQCHVCCGNGRVRCNSCSGFGGSNCVWCHGSGRRDDTSCTSCNGSGRDRCSWCSGHGVRKCKECKGKGQLFMYLQLIVTWKPYVDEFISDSTTIPAKLLSKAKGIRAISEKNKTVYPFTNFPDSAINQASRELINKHGRAYTSQGIIMEQKQCVDIVRIAEVTYTWKEETGTFHVFGAHNNVYFPTYPDTCRCNCCTIM